MQKRQLPIFLLDKDDWARIGAGTRPDDPVFSISSTCFSISPFSKVGYL